jgi:hypothetical protein
LDPGSDQPLATIRSGAVWIRSRTQAVSHDRLASDLPELDANEFLRDRLVPERWLAGLVTIHFLREVCQPGWTPPPLRATLIIDDPNLHWPTYGRLDFRQLDRHAALHAYHLALASIPFDFRLSDPRAVRLFRRSASRMSVAIHGNDHSQNELARPRSERDLLALLAQALRRTARFERRTGLRVSRVMVPPYEKCSSTAMNLMAKLDFVALCHTRSVPYLHPREFSPYGDPSSASADAGFLPADIGPSRLPVIIRRDFSETDEILLRAFLDLPIVLYGHEEDFALGLEQLETAARDVNTIPGVTWCDLQDLAESNYLALRRGTDLSVRPFARRITLRIPEAVETLVLEPLANEGGPDPGKPREVSTAFGGTDVEIDDSTRVTLDLADHDRQDPLTVRFVAPDRVDPFRVRRPRPRPLVVFRRIATEGRDRSRALTRSGVKPAP